MIKEPDGSRVYNQLSFGVFGMCFEQVVNDKPSGETGFMFEQYPA